MEITTEELKEKIKNGEKLIVDFHGLWCGPCRIMKPTFEKIAKDFRDDKSEIQLYTMDIDNNRDFVLSLGIKSIPTIKVFNEGVEIMTKTGLQNESQIKEITNMLMND
jgi:thioredoxin 1